MNIISFIVGILYFLGIVVGLFLLIYFIVKRMEDKKNEKFEKRRN